MPRALLAKKKCYKKEEEAEGNPHKKKGGRGLK